MTGIRRTAFLVCSLALLMLMPVSGGWAQLADSSWPKFHGDSRNSGYSNIVALGGSRVEWSYPGFGGLEGASVAVGPDGAVYTTTRGGVTALNPDGTLRWNYNGGPASGAAAVGRDGTIYYGSTWGYLWAIDRFGRMKWGYQFSGEIDKASPTIDSRGNVYFGTTAGFRFSFQTGTGDVNWQRYIGPTYSTPAIGGGDVLYAAAANGILRAIDYTGTLQWSADVGPLGTASPAVGPDGTIYIGAGGDSDPRLFALSPNGDVAWTAALTASVNGAPAVGPDGRIYLIPRDSILYAFAADGSPLWSYAAPNIFSAEWSSPIIDGAGNIYFVGRTVGYDVFLLSVSRSGAERWRIRIPWGLVAAPAIGPQGQIYTGGGCVVSIVPEPSELAALFAALALSGTARFCRRSQMRRVRKSGE